MGSEGNFEVSFPKRSAFFKSLKQDISNHLFFCFVFFWEFLDFVAIFLTQVDLI